MKADDFMSKQAVMCSDWFALPELQSRLLCVQPLTGRYITIQERSPTSSCMVLCDISLYIEGRYRELGHCLVVATRQIRAFNLILLLRCLCFNINLTKAAPTCGPYHIDASEPGTVISSDTYRELVGEQWECSWFIQAAPVASALKLTVDVLQLAEVPEANVCHKQLARLFQKFPQMIPLHRFYLI